MPKTRMKQRTTNYTTQAVSLREKPHPHPTQVKIKLDIERCGGCTLCAAACPLSNIRMSEKLNSKGHNYAMVIDQEKCTGCGLCYQMCPDLVIEIER